MSQVTLLWTVVSFFSREDAKEIQLHNSKVEKLPVMANVPENIKR